ncbi:MAG: alkaline phosphatase family protein [Bacteroidetes bacterium]|nr:alkaline phosphatase family protein [Bacteroidota bacterium]HET6244559.1 alkaline phosphatase family protein [Bacteroidia bacterium]
MKLFFLKIQYILLALVCIGFSCRQDPPISIGNKPSGIAETYVTENVIIIVMDGPRYSETWGDPNHTHIPVMAEKLAKEGAVFTNFYNNGPTYTNAGHAAITTGIYQEINNNGEEVPDNPSFFQYWHSQNAYSISPWIIASKGKLEILSNCKNDTYKDKSRPMTNCGIGGKGREGGYRDDFQTFETAISILDNYHPKLVLINFMEPDLSGHNANWEGYLAGIRQTDYYIGEIWNFIQRDSIYSDKTTIFVTNDHGRHLDGWKDGFVSHGDNCDGCRHINLYAFGPDFKKNMVVTSSHELIDLTRTTNELLGIKNLSSTGKVLWDIFKKQEDY